MTLSQYIKKRNGVSAGSSRSLRNMLYRSLGAKNFATFWHYWNPIFGYYLGKKVFKPLRKILPNAIALILTFIFCGLLHDAVTFIVRGGTSFLFSTWFLFMGFGVVFTKILKHDFSASPWPLRAFINVFIVGICLGLTLWIDYKLGIR